MTPNEALCFVEEKMIPYFAIGDYKVVDAVKALKV